MQQKHNLRRWLRRCIRVLKVAALALICVTLVPVVVALGRVGFECRPFSAAPSVDTSHSRPATATYEQFTANLKGYPRSEDQTYLTLPEWYIVYSSDEYAAFVANNPPSQFPYFRAIGQFWNSYYAMCRVTREQYPFNRGYHLSLMVIGTSFTIENTLRGLYENSFGRLTELLSSRSLTAEDAYARGVAAEYGTFLHTIPWYEFPFGAKLRGLWSDTPLLGQNIIRKAERKWALSLEYGTKAVYGWLIKQGTQGVYAAEDLEITAWVEGIAPNIERQQRQVRIVKPIDSQTALIAIPRYEAFSQVVPQLARRGVQFVEIAGNDDILVSVIAPRTWAYDLSAGQALFAMPILTQPEQQRIAVKVPVAMLHQVIRDLDTRNITLEHIYDY